MFITTVCVLFLIKLRGPKNKRLYLICGGLGNRVNQVLGQFFHYNDPKWNLIRSVS